MNCATRSGSKRSNRSSVQVGINSRFLNRLNDLNGLNYLNRVRTAVLAAYSSAGCRAQAGQGHRARK